MAAAASLPEDELIHADAYIEALLSRPGGPVVPAHEPSDGHLRRAIELLAGLPRFHPSFAFEESLAARLRAAGAEPAGHLAEVITLPIARRAAAAQSADARLPTFAGIDRRLIVGGAIASGVSLAGLAAYAWLHRTDERTA
jgi:hypothetical protein